MTKTERFSWARFDPNGYEVSSQGDKSFSALYALMPDGRTVEMWYQCDVKGYDILGTNWRDGKGQPPLLNYQGDQLYEMYLSIWRLWALQNGQAMNDLYIRALRHGGVLTDKFATSPINQARALAQILNEWFW